MTVSSDDPSSIRHATRDCKADTASLNVLVASRNCPFSSKETPMLLSANETRQIWSCMGRVPLLLLEVEDNDMVIWINFLICSVVIYAQPGICVESTFTTSSSWFKFQKPWPCFFFVVRELTLFLDWRRKGHKITMKIGDKMKRWRVKSARNPQSKISFGEFFAKNHCYCNKNCAQFWN